MKRIFAAVLCAVLTACLCGCGRFLEREYSSLTPHSAAYYESEDRSVLRTESYQDLVNDLMLLLSNHEESGTIWLYTSKTPLDTGEAIDRACREVQEETPLGAYAVDFFSCTVSDNARNYSELQLTIGYRRTAEQVNAMRHVTNAATALPTLLANAAADGKSELVVQVGYFDRQEDEIRAIAAQVQSESPMADSEPWEVCFYPEGGAVGIVEIILKK